MVNFGNTKAPFMKELKQIQFKMKYDQNYTKLKLICVLLKVVVC